MGILMRHAALCLVAAVLLPHALGEKGPDSLASSQAATAEPGAGDKRRAELTLDGSGDTQGFKCLEYNDAADGIVCMKWEETQVYVAHEACGLTEICYGEGHTKFVNRLGTSNCACQKLSGNGKLCAEFSCKRDYIVQGGMKSEKSSAPAARPCSSCIALLASIVVFLYSC